MIKGANKNPECTVLLRAYDARGETVDQMDYFGRYEPSLLLLEFMMNARDKYSNVVRFTCDIAC
jgi:hypothetical protein